MGRAHKWLTLITTYLFVFVIILFITPSTASAIPIVNLEKNISSYNDFQVDYLVEKPGESLGIEEISKLHFTKTISNAFTFGYKKNNFWFHFSVYNDSKEPKNMVLELTEIIHKTVDLYILSDQIIHKKNGLSVPVEEREIQESNPAFSLHFAPYETKELYVNIASIYAVFGALKLKTPEQFYKDTQFRNNIYIFYFGAIIAIALYNLFIFFYLREKIYLYYVSYVLVFVLWAANYKGFLLPYTSIKTYDILQITIPIFFTLLILFSQTVLETKKYFSLFHKILNGFIVILVISFIWMILSMHSGFYFMNLVSFPLLPFLLFMSFWALYQGHKIARIYLIGLSIYIVSMIIISQLALGIIPYSIIVSNAPIIGSFFELILFSLLLAYRINLLRQGKLDTQEKLLEQKHTEATRLSQMVTKQTAVLLETKKQLEIELEDRKKLEIAKESTNKEIEALNKSLEQRVNEEVEKNRKKDKQLLQQSRMAQMGEMLSMIAHQWRQPLAAISATSASIELKASLNKLDNDTAQQKAQDISNFSQHLSKTIDDFRDFFKPNKKKIETSYDELIISVREITGVSIRNKNIELIQELNCHDRFITYPNEIKQVILNLIKNAEDALLEKRIEKPYIKISTYKENDKYILEVSDNAGGIPEDIIENIFDPYFSTKTQKEGTGLGLYMSKTIIEEHCDGKLTVANNNDGAVFTVELDPRFKVVEADINE